MPKSGDGAATAGVCGGLARRLPDHASPPRTAGAGRPSAETARDKGRGAAARRCAILCARTHSLGVRASWSRTTGWLACNQTSRQHRISGARPLRRVRARQFAVLELLCATHGCLKNSNHMLWRPYRRGIPLCRTRRRVVVVDLAVAYALLPRAPRRLRASISYHRHADVRAWFKKARHEGDSISRDVIIPARTQPQRRAHSSLAPHCTRQQFHAPGRAARPCGPRRPT